MRKRRRMGVVNRRVVFNYELQRLDARVIHDGHRPYQWEQLQSNAGAERDRGRLVGGGRADDLPNLAARYQEWRTNKALPRPEAWRLPYSLTPRRSEFSSSRASLINSSSFSLFPSSIMSSRILVASM